MCYPAIPSADQNSGAFSLAAGLAYGLFPVGHLFAPSRLADAGDLALEMVMAFATPLTVSELTLRIKTVLEGGLPLVWVRGEISQFTSHRSGHCYFTLSDEKAQLSCVLWRGRAPELGFTPSVGDLVLANGKVVVYERGGRYQFDCFELQRAGVGELTLAFEALKQQLAQEGLFALERKIPLPPYPDRVGLVTSPEGAALQDILKIARQRAPWVEFQLVPVHVQGSGAAAEIAAGIRQLDASGWPQVIIVGRGGGSPEDLWAFNEAAVVRAIAQCRIAVVSAVGHEVDVTLADLAADVRAPTPSAAAEICLPDGLALRKRLHESIPRLQRALQTKLNEGRSRLKDRFSLALHNAAFNLWREESQHVDDLTRQLDRAILSEVRRGQMTCERLAAKHRALNPLSILARGYALVSKSDETKPITSSEQLIQDDLVRITFHKGKAHAQITHSEA